MAKSRQLNAKSTVSVPWSQQSTREFWLVNDKKLNVRLKYMYIEREREIVKSFFGDLRFVFVKCYVKCCNKGTKIAIGREIATDQVWVTARLRFQTSDCKGSFTVIRHSLVASRLNKHTAVQAERCPTITRCCLPFSMSSRRHQGAMQQSHLPLHLEAGRPSIIGTD